MGMTSVDVKSVPRHAGAPQARPDMRLDAGEMFDAVASRWRLLPVALATTLSLAGVYIVATPVRYAATMSFLLDNRERPTSGLDSPTAPQGADSPLVENQMRLLTSKQVLHRMADDMHLVSDPDFGGGPPGPLSRLKRMVLGAGAPVEPSVNRVSEILARAITVKRVDKSFVIDVETRASSPEKAERLAQGLASAFLATQARFSSIVADTERKWLDAKIEDLRKRLQEAEARVQHFRETQSVVITDGLTPSDQQIKSADAALVEARGKRAEAEALYAQLKVAAQAGSIETTKQAMSSPLLEKLLIDYAALANTLASMQANLGPRHPAIIAKQLQLADQRAQIQRELRNIAETQRRNVDSARKVEEIAEAHVEELSKAINDGGRTRLELGDLDRQVAVLRANYEKALAAREQNHAEVIAWPNPILISQPFAQEAPVSPKVTPTLIIAVAAAFQLWIVAALVLEYVSRRKATASSAESETAPSPVAAPAPPKADAKPSGLRAPHSEPDPPAFPVALPRFTVPSGEKPGDDASTFARALEAMQSFETPYIQGVARLGRLMIADRDLRGPPPLFAVTARAQGTGVSTLSLCLAFAASKRGERVLVIDCNAKHPTLSALLPYLPPVVQQGDEQGVKMFYGFRDHTTDGCVLLGRLEPGDRLPLSMAPGARLDMILLDCGAKGALPGPLQNALTGTIVLDRKGRFVHLAAPTKVAA